MPTAEGALSGYRVLDLSRGLSGAFCARLFGDQGADVVLLEDAEGHPVRALPPYGDGERGIERSLIHGYANVSKRSVALASESADRASLARRADVVVVSDPDTARRIEGALRPEAVMVGVSAYGLSGAWSELPGNDLTSWSSTSWPLLNGEAGRPPLTGVQHSASCLAAAMAYTGAVAALIRRSERTRHEVVDVSETETLAWLGANGILASAFGEEPAPRSSQAGVFNPPVPVKDGYITMPDKPGLGLELIQSKLEEFAL